MTSLETKSSRDLFKSSSEGGNSQLRNRRDKEQMVTDYSNVTDSLMAISRQLADTVERSKQTVTNLEGTSKTIDEVGKVDYLTRSCIILYRSSAMSTRWWEESSASLASWSRSTPGGNLPTRWERTNLSDSIIQLFICSDFDSICPRILLCCGPLHFEKKTFSNIRSARGNRTDPSNPPSYKRFSCQVILYLLGLSGNVLSSITNLWS